MKINKISWQNYRNLPDGQIDAHGRNVTISGRNGAGKSSIASILPFVLLGKIPSKSFDERGLTIDAQIPSAEIEFDTITLKRVVTARNQNRTFVNGNEVPANEFNARVLNLTHDLGTLMFNPFDFPTSHWKTQRDFLLKHFTSAQIQLAEDPLVLKEKIKSLKADVQGIPYQMTELQRQLSETPDVSVDELEQILSDKQAELEQLMPTNFEREIQLLSDRLKAETRRREELLAKYRSIKTTCPACGQSLPASKVESLRRQIILIGKDCASTIEKLRGELETVQSKADFSTERSLQAKQLQADIRNISKSIVEARNADKLRSRLGELAEREKSLSGRIVELEGELVKANETAQLLLLKSEESINERFGHVRFKLYKLLANGEPKEDCTAMIDGVPFQNLSKGEKLKAALDILRTFQIEFKVEMPLFLDDAESYTSNSFVELPNQLFLFKVTDEDLTITVDAAEIESWTA